MRGALYGVRVGAVTVIATALTNARFVEVGASGLENEDRDIWVLGQSGGQRQAGGASAYRHA